MRDALTHVVTGVEVVVVVVFALQIEEEKLALPSQGGTLLCAPLMNPGDNEAPKTCACIQMGFFLESCGHQKHVENPLQVI